MVNELICSSCGRTSTMHAAMIASVALSLYSYNVSPVARARRLYEHFNGACAEMEDLVTILSERGVSAMTELAMPTARVYLQHAIEEYGSEALHRILANS